MPPGASLSLELNILDIAALVVTGGIAFFIQRWTSRNARNTLLWDICRDHWRSAIALAENEWEPAKADRERATRQKMIRRTADQIRQLDGPDSDLATAFTTIAGIDDWTELDANRAAVDGLTVAMARRFGDRTARRNAERSAASVNR